MLHRARDLLVRQRTQLINAVRGHLAEFGVIAAQGPWNIPRLLAGMEEAGLPDPVPGLVRLLAGQLEEVELRIAEIDSQITAWHKASPVCQRLAAVPGIGPLVATAIVATMPDPTVFRSGREFAAWLGLVPRQNSTGGKTRLGRTSRQGNAYIRRLLVIGAQSALFCSKATKANPWIQALLAKRPRLVVAVALANKMARFKAPRDEYPHNGCWPVPGERHRPRSRRERRGGDRGRKRTNDFTRDRRSDLFPDRARRGPRLSVLPAGAAGSPRAARAPARPRSPPARGRFGPPLPPSAAR